jgi:hypothetical protein
MGTTVIGGMLAASFIGIFIIPAAFYIVEKLSGASAPRNLAAGNLAPGNLKIDPPPAPAQGD